MIEVTRKKKETTLSLLKRFNRKIRQSGNLLRFKNIQYKKRGKSDLKRKREALTREKKQSRLRKLYKLGKIEAPYEFNRKN